MVKKPVVGEDLPDPPDDERPHPWFAEIEGLLHTSRKFVWLDAVHNLIEPPQGYISDNGADNETTAVLCMVMEGLLLPPEHPQHAKAKAAFLACCAKLWDDNAWTIRAE